MQVGTTKDQGLYNKPQTAVHPGALAAGALPQYSTIQHHHKHGVEIAQSAQWLKLQDGRPRIRDLFL